MDQYLTNGTARSIPIFIFIDDEGHEVAKWGPRAPEVQERVSALMSKLPEKTAPNYDEEFKKSNQDNDDDVSRRRANLVRRLS
ncbi:thioredoxin family protein [Geomicrobium sp. JCM 19055]|uniref:thioredoxin family protein n=1 Tax=Geomicrobium sp. JCM 19055 TaxID=1460649 RepID=UPI000B0F0702